MDFLQIILTLDMSVRLSVVLLLACLAGLFSERSGIVDIGLEGKMLIAAFAAGAVAYESGSAWIGMLAGMGAALVFAMIHGVASIIYRGDQIISGVAINFLASGLTVVIGHALYKKGGQVLIKNKPEICPVCSGNGYAGQVGVFEVYRFGDEERDAIKHGDLNALRAALRKRGLPSLQQAALRAAVEGVTSVEEVLRVTAESGKSGGGTSSKTATAAT